MKIRDDIRAYGKMAEYPIGYVAGQLELTTKCEQQCAVCDSWRVDKHDAMEFTWVERLLDDLGDMRCFEHLSFTGGDPLSYDRFPDLINYLQMRPPPYATQINTALPKLWESKWQPTKWAEVFTDVRISLDAATEKTYMKMRGVKLNPVKVIRRANLLKHPNLSFNVTATSRNLHELEGIFELVSQMDIPARKVVVLAVIGERDSTKNSAEDHFWVEFEHQARKAVASFPNIPTNLNTGAALSEKPVSVRDYLSKPNDVKCYAGKLTFHIKPNGDLYPCCLVGGEAIPTRPEFKVGNILERVPTVMGYAEHRTGLFAMHERYNPLALYAGGPDDPTYCQKICQWKQLQLNLAAHEALGTKLAMP